MTVLCKNQRLQSGSSPRVNYAPNFTVVCIISRTPQNEFQISFSPLGLFLVCPSSYQLWKRCAVSSWPNALLSPEQLQSSKWLQQLSGSVLRHQLGLLFISNSNTPSMSESSSWRLNSDFCTAHFLSESVYCFLCFYFCFQTTKKGKKSSGTETRTHAKYQAGQLSMILQIPRCEVWHLWDINIKCFRR